MEEEEAEFLHSPEVVEWVHFLPQAGLEGVAQQLGVEGVVALLEEEATGKGPKYLSQVGEAGCFPFCHPDHGGSVLQSEGESVSLPTILT